MSENFPGYDDIVLRVKKVQKAIIDDANLFIDWYFNNEWRGDPEFERIEEVERLRGINLIRNDFDYAYSLMMKYRVNNAYIREYQDLVVKLKIARNINRAFKSLQKKGYKLVDPVFVDDRLYLKVSSHDCSLIYGSDVISESEELVDRYISKHGILEIR